MPATVCLKQSASEMNSQIGLVLAENLQSRKLAGRNTPLVAVMAGLPEVEHFDQGLLAPSPLDQAPDVPADLEFAVEKIANETSAIDNWRDKQMNIFKEALNALRPLNRCYEKIDPLHPNVAHPT